MSRSPNGNSSTCGKKSRAATTPGASEVVREALRVLEDLETDREQVEVLLNEADLDPAEPGGRRFWRKLRAEFKAGPKRRAARTTGFAQLPVAISHPNLSLDSVGDFLAPVFEGGRVAAFDQQTCLGLGAGVTQ